METTIPITNWKRAVVAVGLVILAFWMHDFIYYDNPKLDETIAQLQSGDSQAIAQALLDTSSLGMAKGHQLIPHILPLLGDNRPVPEHIEQQMIQQLQSTPGAIPGMGEYLRGTLTIGFSAAMSIQALVIVDVFHLRWVGGRAKQRIVAYVTEEIDPNDEYAVSNALAAVQHIHAEKLLPFWFNSLAIESETIRIPALSGIEYYIHDRTHGLFTWHPEDEISPAMAANLKSCLNDPSYFIRQQAEDVINDLKEAGFTF
ncbi:MAG: hypothetical protein CSA49_01985 [Gammaproteobacteria bacterium]|nr:MAG: hypothetical protein CSA49_01985 [Gammaproteobacteria bacterium]